MGFKKPIVAPKIGVLEKRLINQTELLYKSGKLKEKLELVYQNRDLLDDLSKRNYKELDKYSWNDFIKAFI